MLMVLRRLFFPKDSFIFMQLKLFVFPQQKNLPSNLFWAMSKIHLVVKIILDIQKSESCDLVSWSLLYITLKYFVLKNCKTWAYIDLKVVKTVIAFSLPFFDLPGFPSRTWISGMNRAADSSNGNSVRMIAKIRSLLLTASPIVCQDPFWIHCLFIRPAKTSDNDALSLGSTVASSGLVVLEKYFNHLRTQPKH